MGERREGLFQGGNRVGDEGGEADVVEGEDEDGVDVGVDTGGVGGQVGDEL